MQHNPDCITHPLEREPGEEVGQGQDGLEEQRRVQHQPGHEQRVPPTPDADEEGLNSATLSDY